MNTMKLNTKKLAIPSFVALAVALACGPSPALAAPLLGSELSSFAVLGASSVTGGATATTLTGNLGVSNNTSATGITGFYGTLANDGPGTFTGAAHQGDTFATTADGQLVNAMTSLGLLGPGITIADLAAYQLANSGYITPGVYTLSAGLLTGALNLNGLGNANAAWVFQVGGLTAATGSTVNITGTGSGAGVYWNVASTAVLNGTTFAGNVLALTSITSDANPTNFCGGLYAHTAEITLVGDTVSNNCMGGLSGGLDVLVPGGIPTILPVVALVPEPEIYAMMASGLGLMGWVARRRKQKAA